MAVDQVEPFNVSLPLEFGTGHDSGQLLTGVTPFAPTRSGMQEMTVRAPDGRPGSLQATSRA